MRARIIYAHNDLGISEISYEDLVLPQYKGRVCSRTGFHPYNISLFSALVAHHGEEWFEDYIIKLKNNLPGGAIILIPELGGITIKLPSLSGSLKIPFSPV